MKLALEKILKAAATEMNKSPNELLSLWNTTRKDIVEINKDCSRFCKEIETLLNNSNPNYRRLSLLTSNLDCLMFERFLENREYAYDLFQKADRFLSSKGINFLTEAIEREGYIILTP